jgi:hypothetical protein
MGDPAKFNTLPSGIVPTGSVARIHHREVSYPTPSICGFEFKAFGSII